MKLRVLLSVVACVLGCAVCAQASITYNAADDFSSTSNSSGAWTYGHTDPNVGISTFAAFETFTTWGYRTDGSQPDIDSWQQNGEIADPSFTRNSSAAAIIGWGYTWQPGKLAMDSYSGSNITTTLRWQAPEAGTVDLLTTFTDMGATHADAYVISNGGATNLFAGTTTAAGISYATPSSLSVNAGDCIYFATIGGSVTQLDATITLTAVPEPSTILLMLGGLMSALLIRRKR